jgi:hypothetical protein
MLSPKCDVNHIMRESVIMRKALVLSILTLAVMLCSSTVFAWDTLVSYDMPMVTAAGNMWGGVALRYGTADEFLDKDGEAGDLPDTNTDMNIILGGRYGIMDGLDAFIYIPIRSWDDGTNNDSGIGDIWLGAHYVVLPEGLLTLRGALNLPIADEEKGLGMSDGLGIDIAALHCKSLNDQISFESQVGIRYSGEDGDTKMQPGFGFYLDVGANYAFSDALKGCVGLQYMSIGDYALDGTDMSDTGPSLLEINIGAGYVLTDAIMLNGEIQYPLTGANIDKGLGIFVGLGYCMMGM